MVEASPSNKLSHAFMRPIEVRPTTTPTNWTVMTIRGTHMADIVQEIWAGFSLAKLAYSIVLIAIIWLLASELFRVWWDRQLYVGALNYFDDGKSDSAKATVFGGQILAQHHRLRADLNSEQERRAKEAVAGQAEVWRRWPVTKDTISLPAEGLKQLELKIQGFDVGGLLTKIRSWISPVNEVAVTVEARSLPPSGKLIETGVSWPRAPQWEPDAPSPMRYFATLPAPSDDAAATAIAASLLWAEVAKQNLELRTVAHDEFAAWARGWQRYRLVRDRGVTAGKLEKFDTDVLEEAGKGIKPILDRKPIYSEVWRLAANILALHPTAIPNNKMTWEQYRDQYFVAVGLPVTPLPVAASSAEVVAGKVAPGRPVWSEDGQSAVKVTALVEDANGKRFLLLSGLIARNDRIPLDLYTSAASKDRELVARVVKLIPLSATGPKIALAEPLTDTPINNGPITALGANASPHDDVRVLGTDKAGKVESVNVSLADLGKDLIVVEPKITIGGDAGVPIVNGSGELIAMGYAGSQTASILLPLSDILAREKLTLVK